MPDSQSPYRPLRRVGWYTEFDPPAALAGAVDALWAYASPPPSVQTLAAPPVMHRILPEPGVSLYFECWRDRSGRVVDGSLSLQGPIRRVQPFAPSGALHIEAIRVKPEWCRDLFGADVTEHAGGFERFRDVDRARADQLYGRLTRTTTTADALRELVREVWERYERRARSRTLSLTHGAAELIRGSSHELEVPAVARRVGVTERHLRRLLHAATGLGPKQFQRVHRLNRAVAIADRVQKPAWAQIAAQTGYFDQSHMIQDFRALTGRTPSELHRERQAENRHELRGGESMNGA